MIRTAVATEQLDQARILVQQAIKQWNPADLDRLDACRVLLEQAVASISDFETGIRQGIVTPSPDTRPTLLILKRDICRVARMVDAGAAFYRGLAARLGNATPGYDAGGRLFSEAPAMEHELHG
jgi:hypothetical protein